MRLLNTKSHTFKDFFDSDIPAYAILSHRWGDDEITLQEFRKGKNRDSQGYAKVKRFCALAEKRGLAWVWVDTCCIDKKSSAELSEAINSMYRWYKNAEECYVYLSDVAWNSQDVESSKVLFTQSSWFTRGWTLQELLAPSEVIFFDSAWYRFGTKKTLATQISASTDIALDEMQYPLGACIAQKMSWVSRRQTSRSEDMAYCMMGLFDVNMPLLYGEGGPKAFMRLQLEIIKQSDDESIFAWTLPKDFHYGLLAPWPTCFANSGDIAPVSFPAKKRMFPYQMTNQGLLFEVPVAANPDKATELSLALNCCRGKEGSKVAVTVEIAKFQDSLFDPVIWLRQSCSRPGLSQIVKESTGGDERRGLQIKIPQPSSYQYRYQRTHLPFKRPDRILVERFPSPKIFWPKIAEFK